MVLQLGTPMAMEMESSQSYIDSLYSTDDNKITEALVSIKNAVIGSNRQKENAISQGIIPRLLQLAKTIDFDHKIRLEAIIVLGSLAKGSDAHLSSILEYGTASVIMNIIYEGDKILSGAALRFMRTLAISERAPLELLSSKSAIEQLIIFASPNHCIDSQTCVITILSKLPRNALFQTLFTQANASNLLAHLLLSRNHSIKMAALSFFSNMCYENQQSAAIILSTECNGKPMHDLVMNLMKRDQLVETQLEAARCFTNFYRSGAVLETDRRIVFETLPTLVRLVQKEHDLNVRIEAANVLAYLTEIDIELQRIAAISNHLIASTSDLVNVKNFNAKQAAFKVFASLGANDECIRKKIIETERLMEHVLAGLVHDSATVRLASIRCLHSLSRSVQQLRTTFQDRSVWRPLMALWNSDPPPNEELMTVASSTLCNVLLEFSPAKEPMLELGAVQLLSELTHRTETSLRLNGVWALMNMAFCAEQRVKFQILSTLGTDQIFRLLTDPDTRVVMKTLGLLGNLLSTRTHIDSIMSTNANQVIQAVILVLEGSYPGDVKEQALCILANIADGDSAKEYLMTNEDVMKKIITYMTRSDPGLQAAAVFCISNLVTKGEVGDVERQKKLSEMGVTDILDQLISTTDPVLFDKVKVALMQFS